MGIVVYFRIVGSAGFRSSTAVFYIWVPFLGVLKRVRKGFCRGLYKG